LDKDRILLDVGGHFFSTTMETLTSVPGSLLGSMFSGRFPLNFTKDGRVFIDRDGFHFRHILNFLREPDSWSFCHAKDKQLLEELKCEARFFGLEEAMFKNTSRTPQKLHWLDGRVKINSFSSEYESCPATNLIDTGKTYWLSDRYQTEDQWVVFEFEKDVYLTKVGIKVDNYECTVKDWSIQTSQDEQETWKDVMSYTAKCGKECQTEQVFEGFQLRTKFIRLFFKNNWGPGGGSYILIRDIRFYGAEIETF